MKRRVRGWGGGGAEKRRRREEDLGEGQEVDLISKMLVIPDVDLAVCCSTVRAQWKIPSQHLNETMSIEIKHQNKHDLVKAVF